MADELINSNVFGNESVTKLINVTLLDKFFDEWMHTNFHTITASGDKIVVIDKDGTRTETNDLAAAAKTAKTEWDNTYKPQITTATSNANTATSNANTATSAANTAAQGAINVNAMLGSTGGIVTLTVTDRAGNTVTKEVGFRFAKVYPSYAAMQADFSGTDVNQGQFVLISSNVEDPHNAEFYVKNANAWGFMGDLSGAQGIKGDTPVLTALEDGTIYSDGTLLTDIIKSTNATVVSQENTRQQNEQTRQSNETARQQAESGRASTFTANEAQRQSDFDSAQGTRNTTWTNWFSDSLSTGVRKLWNDFWSSVNTSWNGFFGTSASDANGVRKIWSTWYADTQSAWNTWFGTSSSAGVQKDWAELSADAVAKTQAANTAATNANSKATLADQKAALAQQAATDANTAKDGANTAKDSANTAAALANAKAAEAANVNATLSGTVISVTNRNGVTTTADVKGPKGDDLHWEDMSEEDREELAQSVLDSLVFATTGTCESIVDELT